MSDSQRPAYAFRPMTAADVVNAHGLSVALKWPHRFEDWAMLQRVAQGFIAEDNGRLIASSFACHQGDFSTIGLVIVSDDYQGQGIGRRLMNLALETVAPRTAVLNATLSGAPLYTKMGFKDFGEIEQRQGLASLAGSTPLKASDACRALENTDRARLVELANAGTGMDRAALLDELLAGAKYGVGVERDRQLQGFALLRPFGRGLGLGPVVAQDLDQAKHMIEQLLGKVSGAFVRIDIPTQCGLAQWLEDAGLKRVDAVTQMSLGAVPRPSQGVQQYALATQALG
jgi:GNAT superfamily N-acetyltransferase